MTAMLSKPPVLRFNLTLVFLFKFKLSFSAKLSAQRWISYFFAVMMRILCNLVVMLPYNFFKFQKWMLWTIKNKTLYLYVHKRKVLINVVISTKKTIVYSFTKLFGIKFRNTFLLLRKRRVVGEHISQHASMKEKGHFFVNAFFWSKSVYCVNTALKQLILIFQKQKRLFCNFNSVTLQLFFSKKLCVLNDVLDKIWRCWNRFPPVTNPILACSNDHINVWSYSKDYTINEG